MFDALKIQRKNHRAKKVEMLSTILKTFDTIVIFAATSTSVTLPVRGTGLIVKLLTTGLESGLTNRAEVIYELLTQSCNKRKQHYEQSQQANISFDKLYKKIAR